MRLRYIRMLTAGVVAAIIVLGFAGIVLPAHSNASDYLKTGRFRPSFDHLGAFEHQIDAVAASGCTVTYAGLGGCTYTGLPAKQEMQKTLDGIKAYNSRGHSLGVPVILSYLCATSIVNAKTFTANWKDFAPDLPVGVDASALLQQDINGNNLPSWYGEPYNPADTWNPIWRQYQKFLIKLVIQSGHDGVFYDNPTVHTQGNYSPYAMRAWGKFLKKNGVKVSDESTAALRELTKSNQKLWMQFRATEVSDFLREMRDYGRSLKPGFVLTANNSLNIWDSFYDQPRGMGYNIFNMSQSQDFITVEDMSSSPRREGTSYVSYGSTLRMIHAVGHGRPVSVTTIANNSYTTPPEMMQLAIAECTAHDAAYMVWACWDEQHRHTMERSVEQYQDFLESHPDLFGSTQPASDVALVWPYDNWLQRGDCPTAYLAQRLSADNVQYDPITENDLTPAKLREYKCAVWASEESPLKPKTQKMLSEFTKSGGKAFGLSTGEASASSQMESDSLPPSQNLSIVFDGRHFSTEEAEKERLAVADHRILGEPDNTFTSSDAHSSHWVKRVWENDKILDRVVIWWGARETWPASYQVFGVFDGQQRPLCEKRSAHFQREEIVLDKPVVTNQIIVQIDPGGAGHKNPNQMAIQELEAYGSDSPLNLASLDKPQGSALAGTGSVSLVGVKGIRATVRRSKGACILNLYNLNVAWQDPYHDTVEPAANVDVSWLLPKGMKSKGLELECFTPDTNATSGKLAFKQSTAGDRILITFTVPRLYIWSVVRAVSGGK